MPAAVAAAGDLHPATWGINRLLHRLGSQGCLETLKHQKSWNHTYDRVNAGDMRMVAAQGRAAG